MHQSSKMKDLIETAMKVLSGEDLQEAKLPYGFRSMPMRWRDRPVYLSLAPMRWRMTSLRTKGDTIHARTTDAEKPMDVSVVKAEFMFTDNNAGGWNHYVRVYLDPKTWDSSRLGMLFSDTGFEKEFRKELQNQGYPTGPGIQYAESDFQGKDYVTFEIVGKRIEKEWEDKMKVPAYDK